ncbi:MAG: hypothetical protein HWE25_16090 [Alphaproteobacteria bacterium]|nr:hypothetical protein [Alphaproteobacteria bacterium]
MMPREENVTPKNAEGHETESSEAEAAPNFRGLKILVIALGVGIVGMLGLIVYTISQRAAAGLIGDDTTPVAEIVVPVEKATDFIVDRPKGSELVSVEVRGIEMIFHFRTDGADTVIILNRNSGEQSVVTVPR